jgi:hypothetical protein
MKDQLQESSTNLGKVHDAVIEGQTCFSSDDKQKGMCSRSA